MEKCKIKPLLEQKFQGFCNVFKGFGAMAI